MSEDSLNTRNSSNDEIDLLDLFRRISRTLGRWLNALGKGILVSIVFLFRHWLVLFLSVVVGIGVSYLIRETVKPVYKSDMVLKVNIPPVAEMITYINRLHTFCEEKNYGELSKSLSIGEDRIKMVADISAFWVIDNGNDSIPDYVDYSDTHDVYDTVNVRMKDRLDVRVEAGAFEDLTDIKTGILSYLNNNKLFTQRNSLRLKQNDEMITRLAYDIKELDSLQRIKYFQESTNLIPKTGGQMVFLQEQKTQLLYGDIHHLYQRKQTLERETEIYKDIITIISDFTVPTDRSNGLTYYVKTIVPVFFILTLIILIIRNNRKRIVDIYHEY